MEVMVEAGIREVTGVKFLTDNTFVLRFTRGDFRFRAGQHIIVGLKGDIDQREYSIYSGENDDYLEILVREVTPGNISPKLKKCKPGDLLEVNGPFGTFGIESYDLHTKHFVFVGTGTGVSPFRSMIRSYPGIDYTLIHGVSTADEAYGKEEYDAKNYKLCTSKEITDGRTGRVTDYLRQMKIKQTSLFYLCGNGNMVFDAYHLLRERGIEAENIITERYF